MHRVDHTKNIIELRGVSFAYGGDAALQDVNLAIHQGDYLGVIGPNGGGKTTLLKIMLGLLPAQSGEVLLFGQPIQRFRDWQKIGYVSQKAVSGFDPRFPATVLEVVMMGRFAARGLLRWTTAADDTAAREALAQVGMLELKDRLIGDLSGGQQQRVFIARALASRPQVIVLDEPTAGVDLATQGQFYDLLRQLNEELDLTLVLVSHDIGVISEQATEIAAVNRTIVYHGPPERFAEKDATAAIYAHGLKPIHHKH